jgi:translation initiation factor IF-2
MVESAGGNIPAIEVSAKNNIGIKELLELILLVFEIKGTAHPPEAKDPAGLLFKAIVIESKLDPKKGQVATIVVKNGVLSLRDDVYSEKRSARIKSITNDKGEDLKTASPGDAVEILGFEKAPQVGSIISKSPQVKAQSEEQAISSAQPSLTTENTLSKPEDQPILSIILCADTLGSLEAIANALPKEISIALQKTGDITHSDILLAKSIHAIVLGFNIKINAQMMRQAAQEKVLVKNYNLIYELIDDITDVLKGKELEVEEKIFGRAKVLASFPFEKTKVLGISVLEGRVAKGDKVALLRKDQVIGESKIHSMRSGKNPVSKAEKGEEAGVIISPFLDFTIGDMLICR